MWSHFLCLREEIVSTAHPQAYDTDTYVRIHARPQSRPYFTTKQRRCATVADTGKAQELAVEPRRPSDGESGSDACTYQEQLQQQHQQKQQAFEPRSDECSGDDGGVVCCWLVVVVRLLRILRSFSVAGDGPREDTLLICNNDNENDKNR